MAAPRGRRLCVVASTATRIAPVHGGTPLRLAVLGHTQLRVATCSSVRLAGTACDRTLPRTAVQANKAVCHGPARIPEFWDSLAEPFRLWRSCALFNIKRPL
mmetsp:Transcript_47130/g.145951  ORF Transcript_47130/g.145951 Transcript_47130/m.145951 type:complete len:102 (-) Transcript_47130:31-336(-)